MTIKYQTGVVLVPRTVTRQEIRKEESWGQISTTAVTTKFVLTPDPGNPLKDSVEVTIMRGRKPHLWTEGHYTLMGPQINNPECRKHGIGWYR